MPFTTQSGAMKIVLIFAAVVVLVVSPFFIPMIINNVRSHRLMTQLVSAELPSGARIIDSTARVFNSGNGDACDYQALLIVSYYGDVSELRQAYLSFLQEYAGGYPDAQVRSDRPNNGFSWGAKILSHDTELSIQPNVDRGSLYLIVLTHAARAMNFDLRCA